MKSIIAGVISKGARVHEGMGCSWSPCMMIESAEATQHTIQAGSSNY